MRLEVLFRGLHAKVSDIGWPHGSCPSALDPTSVVAGNAVPFLQGSPGSITIDRTPFSRSRVAYCSSALVVSPSPSSMASAAAATQVSSHPFPSMPDWFWSDDWGGIPLSREPKPDLLNPASPQRRLVVVIPWINPIRWGVGVRGWVGLGSAGLACDFGAR